MEIERKFRLRKFPPTELISFGFKYWQGYIFSTKGELRFRRSNKNGYEDHTITIKTDGTLCREEWETRIPPWAFNLLIDNSDGKSIEKIRYILYTNPTVPVLEFDSYRGRLDGLLILEVEFDNEEEAKGFVLPDWASDALEVTKDPIYKNKNLVKLSEPPAW